MSIPTLTNFVFQFIICISICKVFRSMLTFLSGNSLKLIGALLMVIDHIGVFLFPDVTIYRYIGRLSFPIFAFMISEGAKYTRNKTNYLLGIASLALFCQTALYLYDNKNLRMSILVTFSLSIIIIYALNNFKRAMFEADKNAKLSAAWLFLITFVLSYLFTCFFEVDYGFSGVLVPVFASIFDFKDISASEKIKKLDTTSIRVCALGIGLLFLALSMTSDQFLALLAIPLLLLYSGKRGRLNLKYFFYIFYPLHLLILEGISFIIK